MSEMYVWITWGTNYDNGWIEKIFDSKKAAERLRDKLQKTRDSECPKNEDRFYVQRHKVEITSKGETLMSDRAGNKRVMRISGPRVSEEERKLILAMVEHFRYNTVADMLRELCFRHARNYGGELFLDLLEACGEDKD